MIEPPTPDHLHEQVLSAWEGGDLWLFAYASLIWRPGFEADEQRGATVHGFHRAFRLRSHADRGTSQRPGLVFALMHGGRCSGVAYRIAAPRARPIFEQVWEREMPTLVYTPRWLRCITAQGPVQALTFMLERDSPNFTGRIDDATLLEILREAGGRYGTTLDYLLDTARCLHERGIRDREVQRMVRLAHQHGLVQRNAALPTSTDRRRRSSSVSTSISAPASSTSTPNAG